MSDSPKPDGGVGVAETEAGIEAVLKVLLEFIIEARTGGQYRSSQIESPTKKVTTLASIS